MPPKMVATASPLRIPLKRECTREEQYGRDRDHVQGIEACELRKQRGIVAYKESDQQYHDKSQGHHAGAQ